MKGLIQREHLTGVGPKAILLRSEDAALDARLDTQYSEKQVRDLVEDFNARVIDARRQLQGGPPVITKSRDPDVEVQRCASAVPPPLLPLLLKDRPSPNPGGRGGGVFGPVIDRLRPPRARPLRPSESQCGSNSGWSE